MIDEQSEDVLLESTTPNLFHLRQILKRDLLIFQAQTLQIQTQLRLCRCPRPTSSTRPAPSSCSTSSLMSMLTRRRRRLLVLLVGRDLMDVISEQELGRDGRGVGKGRVTCVGVFASSLLGVVDVGEGDMREGWRGGTGGGGRAGGGRGSGRSGGGAFWGISLRCRKREEGRGRE
jgi:uncharacterized membrane protein YgcG